jgi:adenylate kinase family enzyme
MKKREKKMRIIILNGPMGVGKTTVGKAIANKYPGTAFIDGDWCLDIHPFIGNKETKTMAIDNIHHLIKNYTTCSECKQIVLVWLMDEQWVRESLISGIRDMGVDMIEINLWCDSKELEKRWTNDSICEWRTDEWLAVSKKSLPYFKKQGKLLDTNGLNIENIVDMIME